jgi:predicted nuclease with TOPRIM domain
MNEDRSKEILNYVTAMAREVGEFRAETKARFEQLGTRMDGLEARMDGLETQTRAGFEDVRKDLRRLRHSFEVVAEDSTELKIESRDLRKRVEFLEKKVGIEDDL